MKKCTLLDIREVVQEVQGNPSGKRDIWKKELRGLKRGVLCVKCINGFNLFLNEKPTRIPNIKFFNVYKPKHKVSNLKE